MTSLEVLTIGDAKLDAFLTIADTNGKVRFNKNTQELCLKHGEKISVDHTNFSLGGNAANVTVGLSRLGVKTAIAAEIGDDEFALKIVNSFAKEHIDRSFLKQMHGKESSFSLIINFMGDRTIFSEHVKRDHDFSYEHTDFPWLYLTSMGEEWVKPYEKALEYVKKHNALFAFNPGTVQLSKKSDVVRKALTLSEVLFVNKEEAQLLLTEYEGKKHPTDDIHELLNMTQSLGPKIVVITDGKKGSYVLDGEKQFHHLGILEAKVVERTGAGDAYSSGFLAARVHNLSIQEAMQWGSENATGVVGHVGAEAGLLKMEEMKEKVTHDYR